MWSICSRNTIIFSHPASKHHLSLIQSITVRIIPLSSLWNMCQLPLLSGFFEDGKCDLFNCIYSGLSIMANVDSVYVWWINKQEGSKRTKWESSTKKKSSWCVERKIHNSTCLCLLSSSVTYLVYNSIPRTGMWSMNHCLTPLMGF